jgi:hypothetical protein
VASLLACVLEKAHWRNSANCWTGTHEPPPVRSMKNVAKERYDSGQLSSPVRVAINRMKTMIKTMSSNNDNNDDDNNDNNDNDND